MEEALIDSNIIIYAFDNSEPAKQKICREIMGSCLDAKIKGVLSVQNLSEFYNATTAQIKNPIEKETAEKIVQYIAVTGGWKILGISLGSVLRAIAINKEFNVHYFDSLIAAVMEENKIKKIYTENEKDFKRIPNLEVINPFKK